MKGVQPHRVSLCLVAVSVLVLCFGCGDSVIGPQNQPQIINLTDSFAFQATDLRNVTQTTQYTWQNTGTVANVNQACSISSGTAALRIRDAVGAQVYSNDLSANGTFVTSTGASGNWTIEVALSNVTGTINFRVQKRP